MLRSALLASSCALGACATATSPAPSPPTETAATPPPPTSATLAPAKGVTALSLPCTDTEIENGVDDDCDGHIDEGVGGQPGTLELALTWTGPAALALLTEPAVGDGSGPPCAELVPCTLRLISNDWLREPVTVTVERSDDGSQAPPTLTASLCATAHGSSLGCHNFTLSAGESREVARLTAP